MIIALNEKAVMIVNAKPVDLFQGSTIVNLDTFCMNAGIPPEEWTKATHYVGEYVDGEWDYTGFTSKESALKYMMECIDDSHSVRMGKLIYRERSC